MQTPTRFNVITADVTENVLRFKEGYLNKSHYQYAEAVFTSQRRREKVSAREKRVNDKEDSEESERDVKWCLTEMRNKEGGAAG